jgi:hypothetical protein
MRVAAPQAMLDADFEYGLQPTKWQALGTLRMYPSTYEIPGSDLTVLSCTTDASVNTGFFGSSLITVTTSGAHGFTLGQPITVKGLNTALCQWICQSRRIFFSLQRAQFCKFHLLRQC